MRFLVRSLPWCSWSLRYGTSTWRSACSPGRAVRGVPSKDGEPVFVPSKASTIAVGMVLVLFAGLVAATAGLIPSGLPPTLLKWLSLALALGLLARSVGEFRYVGFFKRVRGSRFATMDTFLYSPLCLALALGIAYVAIGRDT